MKCLYYLAPTLNETHRISDDLQRAGVSDWLLHVISRDEAGLKREHIRSSNYLETTDILREGVIGANLGFIAGALGMVLLMLFQPFGQGVPAWVYLSLLIVATLLGAWLGGFYGVGETNRKLERFTDEIDAGKYLILIYARKEQEATIRQMMSARHPAASHVATDRHFINPLAVVRRRRRATSGTPATS